jgi:hypothetical protein
MTFTALFVLTPALMTLLVFYVQIPQMLPFIHTVRVPHVSALKGPPQGVLTQFVGKVNNIHVHM